MFSLYHTILYSFLFTFPEPLSARLDEMVVLLFVIVLYQTNMPNKHANNITKVWWLNSCDY